MSALWLIPVIAILLVGIFFLLRAFIRLSSAMAEVRTGLAQLSEMGPRLQRLANDVNQLNDSIEEKRRQ